MVNYFPFFRSDKDSYSVPVVNTINVTPFFHSFARDVRILSVMENITAHKEVKHFLHKTG